MSTFLGAMAATIGLIICARAFKGRDMMGLAVCLGLLALVIFGGASTILNVGSALFVPDEHGVDTIDTPLDDTWFRWAWGLLVFAATYCFGMIFVLIAEPAKRR